MAESGAMATRQATKARSRKGHMGVSGKIGRFGRERHLIGSVRRAMEKQVRNIRSAMTEHKPPSPGLGSRIASRFMRIGLTEDLPQLRGQTPRAVAGIAVVRRAISKFR